ncbi:MAG: ACT domain-containing protein [Candidatus Gracilibacteria bacterium]|nr:ACT domain-containing protein [Candidatus Gracilibacteria bacterium]
MKAIVVNEVTFYLSNHAGALADVTKLLADAGVSIRGLLVSEGFGKSVVRVVVEQEDKALNVLAGAGIDDVSRDHILEVTVASKAGVIADLSARLSKENINIENIYVTESTAQETLCYVSVSEEQVDEAVRVLGE